MAEVSIVDIGGVQWTVKDKEARNSIEAIIAQITPKKIGSIPITINSGYSASEATILNIVQFGKLYTGLVRISNVRGDNIGSSVPAIFGKVNFTPITYASAVGMEIGRGKPIRITILEDGAFSISESVGINNGNNYMLIPITWFEE